MVSSEKMLLNTGTPSGGQPVPVVGWQIGEEYGRRPTRVIAGDDGPPATEETEPYGKCRLKPAGSDPAGRS